MHPMQKWLLLNYSFVRIQNSLGNLVWDDKFFTIFFLKNEVSEANLNTSKRINNQLKDLPEGIFRENTKLRWL